MNEILNKKIQEQLTGQVPFLVNEPMSKHTSFRIGGCVDIFTKPRTVEEIEYILNLKHEFGFNIYVIGKGSNILVSDDGLDGVVIEIAEEFSKVVVSDTMITAQSGITLSVLSEIAVEHALTGVEFASGIPGTLGGAVFMNAGAYGGNMEDIITNVKVLSVHNELDDITIRTLTNEQLGFGYRQCSIQNTSDIVIEAQMHLEKGDREQIIEVIEDLSQRRKSKQPLNLPSAGSVFKRPEGYYAGQLIDEAGLRGLRYGDAQVSEKHCGFIVNRGKATASEVMKLIQTVQQIVYNKSGVYLETELRLVK